MIDCMCTWQAECIQQKQLTQNGRRQLFKNLVKPKVYLQCKRVYNIQQFFFMLIVNRKAISITEYGTVKHKAHEILNGDGIEDISFYHAISNSPQNFLD